MENPGNIFKLKLRLVSEGIAIGSRHIVEEQGMRVVWTKNEHVLINLGQFEDETPP